MKNIAIGIMVLMSVFLAQSFVVAIENNATTNATVSMNLGDLARPASVPMILNSSMATAQPANVPKTLKVGSCKSCNKICCEYSTSLSAP